MLDQSHAQRPRGNEEAPPDRGVPFDETGKILGVCRRTVSRYVQRGLLEAFYLSKRCGRIRMRSIKNLMDEGIVASPPELPRGPRGRICKQPKSTAA